MINDQDDQRSKILLSEAEEDLCNHHSIQSGIKTNEEPRIEFSVF